MNLRRILALALALLLVAAVPSVIGSARAEMPYRIEVDLTNQIVTVFSTADDTVVRQMLCSSGKYKPTPQGTFKLPEKRRSSERTEWYQFPVLDVYAKWATRIKDKILFHSIPYNTPSLKDIDKEAVSRFGSPASHSCVRLLLDDAKWIAQNCMAGTQVDIFKSGKEDPELRAMLKLGSFTIDDGVSYKRYLGLPEEEGELGRYSTGIEVSNLQYRLRDLGVFEGEPDGSYDTDTFVAVRRMQILMKQSVTGTATLAFQEAVFSDDAPTAMAITLKPGYGGTVVRDLQQHLQELGIYDGPVNSIYDQQVANAVTVFETAYGYLPNGEASPDVQKAIYYESGKVGLLFARSGGYTLDQNQYSMTLGVIEAQTGIRVREKASTESEERGRVVDGNTVIVMDRTHGWAKIRYGDCVGYIKERYVNTYEQPMSVLNYRSQDGDVTYTIGCSQEQYFEGTELPSQTFADYLAAGGSLEAYAELGAYARVNTEGPGVNLNLREAPNTNSAVLAEVPYGVECRILLNSSQWTLVEYEGMRGYLMNEYIEFLADVGTDAPADLIIESDDATARARIQARSGDKAPVYDSDSDDANLLGHLKNGIEVQVVRVVNDWAMISYEGHNGYMLEDDLSYLDEIEG